MLKNKSTRRYFGYLLISVMILLLGSSIYFYLPKGEQGMNSVSIEFDAHDSMTFHEGDFLAYKDADGWNLTRVLKIDFFSSAGEEDAVFSVSPLGKPQEREESEEVYIVDADPYDSLDELKQAVKDRSWIPSVGHLPLGSDTFLSSNTRFLVGNEVVTTEDLDGYNMWKEDFDKGEAGVW